MISSQNSKIKTRAEIAQYVSMSNGHLDYVYEKEDNRRVAKFKPVFVEKTKTGVKIVRRSVDDNKKPTTGAYYETTSEKKKRLDAIDYSKKIPKIEKEFVRRQKRREKIIKVKLAELNKDNLKVYNDRERMKEINTIVKKTMEISDHMLSQCNDFKVKIEEQNQLIDKVRSDFNFWEDIHDLEDELCVSTLDMNLKEFYPNRMGVTLLRSIETFSRTNLRHVPRLVPATFTEEVRDFADSMYKMAYKKILRVTAHADFVQGEQPEINVETFQEVNYYFSGVTGIKIMNLLMKVAMFNNDGVDKDENGNFYRMSPTQKFLLVWNTITEMFGLNRDADMIYQSILNSLFETVLTLSADTLNCLATLIDNFFNSDVGKTFERVKNKYVPATLETNVFDAFANSTIYYQLKEFLTKLTVAIGTMNLDDKTLFGYAVGKIKSMVEFTNSSALILEFVNLVRSLVKGGYIWYSSGDWRQMFVADKATIWYTHNLTLVQEIGKIINNVPTREAQEALLQEIVPAIKEGQSLLLLKGVSNKTFIPIKALLQQLVDCQLELGKSIAASGPHCQPMVVQIYGQTAVGKSSVVFALANNFMLADGIKDRGINNIFNANPRDQYDSAYRNGQVGFFLDELGAVKEHFDKGYAHTLLMAVCNIMPTLATMADLESKGKNYLHFRWGFITSNFEDCKAGVYMNNYQAFMRRLEYLVVVALKPEFRKKLEAVKVNEYCLDREKLANRDIIDAQMWQIYKRSAGTTDVLKTKMFVNEHNIMEKLDISEDDKWIDARKGIDLLTKQYKIHRSQQNLVVQNTDSYFTKSACETCGNLFCVCPPIPTEDVVRAWTNANVSENSVYVAATAIELTVVGFMTVLVMYITYKIRELFFIFSFWLDKLHYWMDEEKIRNHVVKEINLIKDQVQSNIIKNFKDTYIQHRKTIMGLLAGSASIYAMYKLYKYTIKPKVVVTPAFSVSLANLNFEVDSGKSYPYKYPVSEVKNHVNRIVQVDPAILVNKITTYDSLIASVRRQTFLVKVQPLGEFHANLGTCLQISQHWILVNRHVLQFHGKFPEMATISFEHESYASQPALIGKSQIRDIKGFEKEDMVLIEINVLPSCKDLRDLIAKKTKEDTWNIPGKLSIVSYTRKMEEGKLEFVRDENSKPICDVTKITDFKTEEFSYDVYHGKGLFLTSEKCLYVGNSGSPIVCSDPPCIVSILCAATPLEPKQSISCFIPQLSDIESDIPEFIPMCHSAVIVPETSPKSIIPHLLGKPSKCVYHGTLADYSYNTQKTNFTPSICYDLVKNRIKGDLPMPGILHSRVVEQNSKFYYVDPYLVTAAIGCHIVGSEPSRDLACLCYNDYVSVLDEIPVDESKRGGPLTVHQALNSEIPFNRMKVSTAAGYPLGKKKKDHLVQNEDGSYDFKEFVAVQFEHYRKNFFQLNERPIVGASVKDELRKPQKIAEGGERIFYASPFFFLVLCRQYLMPIMVFWMEHSFEFEHCVGINAMDSNSWMGIHDYVNTYPYKVDGDFEKFDQRHLVIFFRLFILYCIMIVDKYLNYTPFDKAMVHLLLSASLTPLVNLKGDLVEFLNTAYSGKFITIMLNCFMSSMYIRLGWFTYVYNKVQAIESFRPYCKSFRNFNKLMTYGDDNMLSTVVESFNFSTLKWALQDYGIVYTPSDKGIVIKDNVNLEEIKFLKRGFLKYEWRGRVFMFCPLEENSIWKSLLYVKCPKGEEKHQLAKNVVDAQKQFFFHGEEVFENRKSILKDIVAKVGLDIGLEGSGNTLRWFSFEELILQYDEKTLTMAYV